MNKAFYLFVLSYLYMCRFATADDWTEHAGRWYWQSYWNDNAITQSYKFHSFGNDKVEGASSVAVDIDVSADKPRNMVELRFEPATPLNLSEVEAITLSVKSLSAGELKLRDIFLCSPGFQKLATVVPKKPVVLESGADWRKVDFDLAEANILDKSLPAGKHGTYNRREVATICINLLLPEGRVRGRILIDGLKPTEVPPSPVVRTVLPGGEIEIATPHYHVLIGSDGYIQSIQADKFDFLRGVSFGGTSAPTASAAFQNNNPSDLVLKLDTVRPEGRTRVHAIGDKLSLRYTFREHDFDIEVRQNATSGGLNLNFVLADDVVACLDGRTDRALYRRTFDEGPQISSRLMTNAGPVLLASQHVVGYSRVATKRLPGDVWAWQFLSWGSGSNKLTLRPIGNPAASDAIGVSIDCTSDDFLLSANQPVSFDLRATNYSAEVQRGEFSFQICDYLTREIVSERITPFELNAGEATLVPTQIEFDRAGVFRGRFRVADDQQHARTVDWVFTRDFPNYAPRQRRPNDFDEFWEKTLLELDDIPMAAEMIPVPDQSDEHSEAFKVSLATLNGRRFHGWYWRPRKPGRYPVRLELPSSGIYKRTAEQVPHGSNYCGMWIAVHGLPVEPDLESRPDDPAAWNYWTHGIESPRTSMWRTIYASMVRAVDFLATRPEVDTNRIMASGGSQGGGLTIVLAGLDQRISFAAPAHSGLCRLDWTVKFKPGFWPFDMSAKPVGQSEQQFLHTLSYFDAANFASRIQCPVFAEVSLLDTVTASGNQIAALTNIRPGLLELICDPWHSHASSVRGSRLRSEAINRWLNRQAPIRKPRSRLRSRREIEASSPIRHLVSV